MMRPACGWLRQCRRCICPVVSYIAAVTRPRIPNAPPVCVFILHACIHITMQLVAAIRTIVQSSMTSTAPIFPAAALWSIPALALLRGIGGSWSWSWQAQVCSLHGAKGAREATCFAIRDCCLFLQKYQQFVCNSIARTNATFCDSVGFL